MIIPARIYIPCIVALALATAGMHAQRDQARTALADYRAQVAQATARAEAHARAQETALRGEAEQIRSALEKESQNAETAKNRLLAGIRAGTERLSIDASCPAAGQAATDPGFAAGAGPESARAELDRSAAEALVAIATDGDTAIRERNACIALYDATRATLNQD